MSTGFSTVRAATKVADHDRLFVGGVDVTFFRGKRTPTPPYGLMEPLAYGAMTLVFPQVYGPGEPLGEGDLHWAKIGARVVLQRVDPVTGLVVATDYRGVITDRIIQGRPLKLAVAGQVAGPLGLMNRQAPMYRKMRDVGRWAKATVQLANRLQFEPTWGPETGIEIPDAGEMSELAWAQNVGSLSQNNQGLQRTIMPITWGGSVWEFRLKDYTTIHNTLYTDDERAVLDVIDAAAERPNTFFGRGIEPDGMRYDNGKMPGLFTGPPPPYPMASGDPFGIGTTDAETRDGSGITVLRHKLATMGYIHVTTDDPIFHGVYDQEIADAVEVIQDRAGLTSDGEVTPGTWKALWDIDVTGDSLQDTGILPMAQDPRVRRRNYTETGSFAGRNPLYDASILRVDRNVDFGPGVPKAQAIRFLRGQLKRSLTMKNWVGRITLNGVGVISGEHNPGDEPILDGDGRIVSYRGIRAGTNLWCPLFDGGTLFHIAGIDLTPPTATSPPVAVLTVDTQARDLLEVRQIIERNRESRRDPRREWRADNRGGKSTGNMVTWDELGGVIDRDITLTAGRWNVFPVPAGQQGQVQRIDLRTLGNKAAFYVAVLNKKYNSGQLLRRLGDPTEDLDEDGNGWFNADIPTEMYNAGILLYSAGDVKQPCGYWPKKHTSDAGNTTSAPVTGRWLDTSPWPYLTDNRHPAVLWIAIWPDRNTRLLKGRILRKQEDDAV